MKKQISKMNTLLISLSVMGGLSADDLIIIGQDGSEIGGCVLQGAAFATIDGELVVDGTSVTGATVGDLVVKIDHTDINCNLGGSSNTAPNFVQSSPYSAASVTVNNSRSMTLSANDGDGDTISWAITQQASLGTASVTGTGTSKTVNYAANGVAGNDSFVVTVSDGNGGSDSLTVNITVSNVQQPAGCEAVTHGLSRDTSAWRLGTNPIEFTPLKEGETHSDVSVQNGKYKAKQTWDGLTDGMSGQISFEHSGYGEPGTITYAISECLGDFGGSQGTDVDTKPKCTGSTNTTGIGPIYYTTPNATQTLGCMLDPGKTYYLNVIHAESNETLSTSSCSSSSCEFNVDTIEQ